MSTVVSKRTTWLWS